MDTKPISAFLNEVESPHYNDVLAKDATLTMREYRQRVVDMARAAEAELLQAKVNEPGIDLSIIENKMTRAYETTKTRKQLRMVGAIHVDNIEGRNDIDDVLYFECSALLREFNEMFNEINGKDTSTSHDIEPASTAIKESETIAPQREWYNAKEICEVFPALSYNNVKDAQWRAKTGFDKCAQQLGKKSKITFNRKKVEDWILNNMDPNKVENRIKRADAKGQKR